MNDFRLILKFRILEWICGELNESKLLNENKRTFNEKTQKNIFLKKNLNRNETNTPHTPL